MWKQLEAVTGTLSGVIFLNRTFSFCLIIWQIMTHRAESVLFFLVAEASASLLDVSPCGDCQTPSLPSLPPGVCYFPQSI